MLKAIQDSRKQLKALETLSNDTIQMEERFTDELHLFFQYLGRKILENVDLKQPLEAIFYQQVNSVIEKYWKEYDDILSFYVDESAVLGNYYYELLLSASKERAEKFQATKAKDNRRQFLDNKLTSSNDKELWAPNPRVAEHLDKYKFEASDKTKSRVTNEINQILGEGYREGWGHRDVASKIQNKFTQLSTYESRRIAQTEINTTRNMVQYGNLQDDGMEYKIWHAAHDTRTRKSHLNVDEEIVPINEKFSNGLMYPGDKSGPIEEWVNCRCSHAAYIMPLGYTAPDFWPFTENDLVKVGSSISQSYVPNIIERLRLIDGAIVREQEKIIEEEPVETISERPYSNEAQELLDDFERKVPKKKEHMQFFTDDGLSSPIAKGNASEVRMSGKQKQWLEDQTKKGKSIHGTHNHPTEYSLDGEHRTLLSSSDCDTGFLKVNSAGINLVSFSAEGPVNRVTISKLDNYDNFSYGEKWKALSYSDALTTKFVDKYYKNSPTLKLLREEKAKLKAQGIDWRTKMREDPEWWESIQRKIDAKVTKMRNEEHDKLIKEINKHLNPVGIKVESVLR